LIIVIGVEPKKKMMLIVKRLIIKILVILIPKKLRVIRNLRRKRFLLNKMPKHSICAEIGVFEGDFSDKILKIVNPKELHLIDSWEWAKHDLSTSVPWKVEVSPNKSNKRYQKVVNRFKTEIKDGEVIIDRGYSQKVLKKFEDNYFDWIYVDGNHWYDYVRRDLELSYLKVKRGGFISGDDYGNDGDDWWKENTTKAVDDFISKGLVTVIQMKNHQFILQK